MVYLQAVMSETGPAAACLDLCERDFVEVSICPAIVAELRRVLERPELRAKVRRLTDERVAEFLKRVTEMTKPCPDPQIVVPIPRDPKDESYLNLAIEHTTAFLVSRDKDLLSLSGDDAFCKSYPSLAIVEPPEFLRQVRIQIATDLGYE